jgi:hypothetical protein
MAPMTMSPEDRDQTIKFLSRAALYGFWLHWLTIALVSILLWRSC